MPFFLYEKALIFMRDYIIVKRGCKLKNGRKIGWLR